jgi:hypothetical protein
MKTVKLEIKAANKITSFLTILGWTAFILGLILFLVLDKSIQNWGLFVSLPFVVSLLVFLLLSFAFPIRKVGEVKLEKKKIQIDEGKKPKSLSYSDISKISLLLYPSAKRFHRDWWPITDEPIAYEPSSKNYLIVKPKKGKSINVPVFLGSKRAEEKLLDTVQKNCRKYKIGLRIK